MPRFGNLSCLDNLSCLATLPYVHYFLLRLLTQSAIRVQFHKREKMFSSENGNCMGSEREISRKIRGKMGGPSSSVHEPFPCCEQGSVSRGTPTFVISTLTVCEGFSKNSAAVWQLKLCFAWFLDNNNKYKNRVSFSKISRHEKVHPEIRKNFQPWWTKRKVPVIFWTTKLNLARNDCYRKHCNVSPWRLPCTATATHKNFNPWSYTLLGYSSLQMCADIPLIVRWQLVQHTFFMLKHSANSIINQLLPKPGPSVANSADLKILPWGPF